MVTILLQKIIELLTGFFGDFIEWANTVGDKIASIKDNTDSLPDIETNTDTIANDTTAINNGVNTLNTRASQIFTRVNSIDQNTGYIKNYSQSIATSSGTAAAFAEDIANNTLNTYDKVTTIASDTTQMRADNQVVQADLDKIYDAIRWSLINVPMTETESGESPLIFNTDMAEKLNYIKCLIEAVETGSGTKSPSNPYTISSISDLDLTVNGVQTTLALGQTVYGGEIVLTKKASGYGVKLRVTSKQITLNGSQTIALKNWQPKESSVGFAYSADEYDGARPTANNVALDGLTSDQLTTQSYSSIYGGSVDWAIAVMNSNAYGIFVRLGDTSLTTDNAINAYLSDHPINVIYPLATPIEIDLTDASDIVALVGVNTISSNGNGDITVTYTESVKHYLDKQEA